MLDLGPTSSLEFIFFEFFFNQLYRQFTKSQMRPANPICSYITHSALATKINLELEPRTAIVIHSSKESVSRLVGCLLGSLVGFQVAGCKWWLMWLFALKCLCLCTGEAPLYRNAVNLLISQRIDSGIRSLKSFEPQTHYQTVI